MKTPLSTVRDVRAPRRRPTTILTALLLAVTLAFGGCAAGDYGDRHDGALIGGGLGVAAGAIVGRQSGHAGEGAALGGLIGAGTGYAIGAERDLRRERGRRGDYYEAGYGDGYDDARPRRPAPRHDGYGRYDYDPYCR